MNDPLVTDYVKQFEQETVNAGGDVVKAIQRIERHRADELIRDAIQASRNGEKDWDTLAHYLGRNDKPMLLLLVWHRLAHDQQGKAIADAWTSAEFPERQTPTPATAASTSARATRSGTTTTASAATSSR